MAITDIVIGGGRNDFFLLEIPLGTLNSPDDILFGTSIIEFPIGSLNIPEDILFGKIDSHFIMEIPNRTGLGETFTVFMY